MYCPGPLDGCGDGVTATLVCDGMLLPPMPPEKTRCFCALPGTTAMSYQHEPSLLSMSTLARPGWSAVKRNPTVARVPGTAIGNGTGVKLTETTLSLEFCGSGVDALDTVPDAGAVLGVTVGTGLGMNIASDSGPVLSVA